MSLSYITEYGEAGYFNLDRPDSLDIRIREMALEFFKSNGYKQPYRICVVDFDNQESTIHEIEGKVNLDHTIY